jgi:CPA2 family monovalent cation:H+ antiporter-2
MSRLILPGLLERAAQLRSRELFTMVATLTVIGMAVIAERIGLTLSVGAFVGGLVLARTPYAHQLFAEVLPLRGFLLGIFFTAVGMLFDWQLASQHWAAIVAYMTGVVIAKTLFVTFIVSVVLRQGLRLGLLAGFALAQTGEFSFVLAASADEAGLLSQDLRQVFVAGSIATLLLTPFLVRAAPRFASWVTSDRSPAPALGEPTESPDQGHVLLIGFGLGGQNIARILKARGTPYMAIDANAARVRSAQDRGEPALYGDATRRGLLERAGLEQASMIVIAISDPIATREVAAISRALAPTTPILARTRYVLEVDMLERSGATKVVVEELEATLELITQLLRTFGVPQDAISRFTTELRDEGYVFLRSPDEILDPWLVEQLEGVSTDWVEVPATHTREASLVDLDVRARTGATVVAVQREGATLTGDPNQAIRAGDRLLVVGGPDAITRLRRFLEAGPTES